MSPSACPSHGRLPGKRGFDRSIPQFVPAKILRLLPREAPVIPGQDLMGFMMILLLHIFFIHH